MGRLRLLRYLTRHPINRRARFRALPSIINWKISTRLLPGCDVIIPYVNDARLVVTPGQWGSEANALCGLHDFSDMGFLLHFLRPNDLFCDVGANVGEYTILASAAIGARAMAFEPIHQTYLHLKRNIAVNDIGHLVDAKPIALGSKRGHLKFTDDQDTQNHVLTDAENSDTGRNILVEVDTLDGLLGDTVPQLMKIDVEGWEFEVLRGSEKVLRNPYLHAIIIELNKSGMRYGYSDEAIHQSLVSHGFSPWRYLPFDRKLISLHGKHNGNGNTLYIRNFEFIAERLLTTPSFSVRGLQV